MMSRRSIDMLIDLVENRMACMQVVDREDHRQFAILSQARRELQGMKAVPAIAAGPAPSGITSRLGFAS